MERYILLLMKKIIRTITGCTLLEFGYIVLGGAIIGLTLVWFAAPAHIVAGGVTGVAIILSHICEYIFGFPLSLGLLNLVFNIPLFVFGFIKIGFKFVRKSCLGMLMLSFWLFVFENIPILIDLQGDILLAALLNAVGVGLGLALVIRAGATTGGADLFSACIHKISPRLSISHVIFLVDAIIITAGLVVFGPIQALYSILSAFIVAKVMSGFLGGVKFAKTVYILSDKSEEISKAIFKKLNRGNTGVQVKGMYSKKQGHMLLVVVKPYELPDLKNVIKEVDEDAFIIISSAQEVLGTGFHKESSDDLF